MHSGLYYFLLAVLILMFTVHALALGGFLGYGLWWLDMTLHFVGGLWVAGVAYWFIYEYKKYPRDFVPLWLLGVGLVSFALFAGVLWEFFEFLWDYFFAGPYNAELAQPTLEDTMSDLFFDLAGAVIAVSYFLRYHNRGFGNF